MKKYITWLAVVSILLILGNSIYNEINKEKVPGKAKRIPCLAKVTSFERGYGIKDIKDAQDLLTQGSYTITSGVDKATYMESTLFDHIDLKELDLYIDNELKTLINKKTDNNELIKIDYKIYENDKEDPKKKSDKCKLFRGYTVMKFINNKNKVLYQVQIDFMDYKGKDIPQTLKCSIESFLTYK